MKRRAKKQVELPSLVGRGGAGRGQGRKRGPRVQHCVRPYLDSKHPVHVSTRVNPGLPSLRGRRLWSAVRRAFVHACDRNGTFRITHFSVQGQHVHLLCEAKNRVALSRGMQAFKIRAARAINKALRRAGSVFEDRYHQRVLKTPTECRHALAYVLGNQRHHAAEEGASYPSGTVDPWSSAMVFDGWSRRTRPWARPPGAPPGDADTVRPAVSWLLREGWRRAGGPLDPDHIPGLPRGAPALPCWEPRQVR